MQYIGGKQKSGGHKIASHVKRIADAFGSNEVTEPFCGGLSVTYRLRQKHRMDVYASDYCEALICLYVSLQSGWVPPDVVTKETWAHYKDTQDPSDPMTAFCGFGCSRSGAWFSGFVSDYKYTKRRVPAATAAKNSVLKKIDACKGTQFKASSFELVEPRGVIYCDIPYIDSMVYPAVGPFDHPEFWAWARETSKSRPVIVSERWAPDDFSIVDEWGLQSRITTSKGNRRIERVFVHERYI
jgi:DNA adenine methylase